MNRRTSLILLALAAGVLRAQPKAVPQGSSGTVVAVDRNVIFLNGGTGSIAVKTNAATRIWKGEDGVDISAIQPGDELAMRGVRDADGTFVPSEMWANITALDGIIESVNGPDVEVQVIRNYSVSEKKHIRLTTKTLSSHDLLKREHVQVGRDIRVIGLALADGTIQASRVTVYVNGRPVDSVATKYMDPQTGKIIHKP
jgi:hypothetical protein